MLKRNSRKAGDAINAVLATAGSNLRKLRRRLAAAPTRWLERITHTHRPANAL